MTIREVAKRAGVSLQTVSNVINGRTTQMGEETRNRVLQVIQELDYHPNAHARGLRSQRTSTISFFTVDPSARFLSDPFHVAILSGMADTLREQEYCLLVQAMNPDDPVATFLQLYQQRRFDGAVIHLSGSQEDRVQYLAKLDKSNCPFVLIEEKAQGPRHACVLADNREGAERAVHYLLTKGHTKVAFLMPERSWPAVEERVAGYQAALRAHRLPGARRWTVEGERIELARSAVEAALAREPGYTAVLCANDVLALGAIQAARALGRRVPEDMAIIGFDDFDFAQHVDPPLTTVALPTYDMGRRAADLLVGYLRDGSFAEAETVFPTTLILRQSA
jgi:DNA-binding LacI/PurR family transcriptional regulator